MTALSRIRGKDAFRLEDHGSHLEVVAELVRGAQPGRRLLAERRSPQEPNRVRRCRPGEQGSTPSTLESSSKAPGDTPVLRDYLTWIGDTVSVPNLSQ